MDDKTIKAAEISKKIMDKGSGPYGLPVKDGIKVVLKVDQKRGQNDS